jgi:hypothetical protein
MAEITGTRIDPYATFITIFDPLGIGGIYESGIGATREKIRGYIYSDQDSAVNGVQIYQSVNGTDWDYVTQYSLTGGTPLVFVLDSVGAYFKVKYTNGGVAQTIFSLRVSSK